jgi:hypothetical protein
VNAEELERLINHGGVVINSRWAAAAIVWGTLRGRMRLFLSEMIIVLPALCLGYPMVSRGLWSLALWLVASVPFWLTAHGMMTAFGCVGVLLIPFVTFVVAVSIQPSTWQLAGPLVVAWVWKVGHGERGRIKRHIRRAAMESDDLRDRLFETGALVLRGLGRKGVDPSDR